MFFGEINASLSFGESDPHVDQAVGFFTGEGRVFTVDEVQPLDDVLQPDGGFAAGERSFQNSADVCFVLRGQRAGVDRFQQDIPILTADTHANRAASPRGDVVFDRVFHNRL